MAKGSQPDAPHSDTTDQTLLSRIAQGDVTAFEALYQRHWHKLLTYLIGQLDERPLAEDVLQEVMLAAWHGAARFRGEASVSTWLFAIARHHALKARQHRVQLSTIHALEDQIAESRPSPAETVEQHEHRAEVHAALAQLPAQQREVIELMFYHGLTGPEVATVTGVALGTVKSRLRRAKTLLLRLFRLQEITDA